MARIFECVSQQNTARHTFKRYHYQRIMTIYISKWSQEHAHLVKGLLHRHDDLSLNPQHLLAFALGPVSDGGRMIPEAPYPVILAKW